VIFPIVASQMFHYVEKQGELERKERRSKDLGAGPGGF